MFAYVIFTGDKTATVAAATVVANTGTSVSFVSQRLRHSCHVHVVVKTTSTSFVMFAYVIVTGDQPAAAAATSTGGLAPRAELARRAARLTAPDTVAATTGTSTLGRHCQTRMDAHARIIYV